ncbi:MAG: metallophosphoesterase family protein [Saonia sp.]
MDKNIAHIAPVSGKLLLFGGIYSNLHALQRLIAIAKENKIKPENCICTGDIVGYCALPEETVQRFKSWGARSIAGNVEVQLGKDAEDCGCDFTQGSRCDGFSKLWYPFAKEQLSLDSLGWMRQLPHHISFGFAGKRITVVHGSYHHTSEFIFKSTPESLKRKNFETTQSDIIVAGHSGLPFHQKIGERLWLNPGVIGMPANDGTARTWYMILEEIDGKIVYTHRYLEYDHHTAHQLMLDRRLPSAYADTLLSGIWDNMEILPETEKRLQGIPYNFEDKKEHITINHIKG